MARRLSQLAHLPVTELRGVGAKAAGGLAQAYGIETVLDLLTHYPRRWIDRTRQARIADLDPGTEAMVVAEVQRISSRRTRGRPPRTLVTATVADETGRLAVTFFNQGWRERQLPPGTTCVLFGKVDTYRGSLQMTNPLVDLIGDQTGRLVPVYPQSDKARITSQDVGRWMTEVLERAGTFAEPLPDGVRRAHRLTGRTEAFRGIHQPADQADIERARKRLVFDELLRIQLALILRKRALERTTEGIAHSVGGPRGGGGEERTEGSGSRRTLVADFHARLPFPLTGAQRRVIEEITADLAEPHPMHRLLQGDVGAGKTLVALTALLVAVQGGHQGALMAPTEVLAEQHHLRVRSLLAGLEVDDGDTSLFGRRPVAVELLTARAAAAERKRILAGLAQGEVDIVIGTHALIQEGVSFRSLGVVVVDEQHRFGVEQRAALKERGAGDASPDVLVMTATPIPRTAAMTVYGDLDVSVLDEMPPGRTPIRTVWVRTVPPEAGEAAEAELVDPEEAVWAAVRDEVAAGRQAYVVCPLIEGSEKLEARSAQETYDELTAPGVGELDGLRVELLHGRMASADKEAVMERFRRGQADVLVATTVIEVGVDVPNATVMVVLDADRFGIAQLHQLRGRVGRGSHRSTCYLVASGATEEGEARLKALVRTNDGFELAEVDLDLRGEGTLMGERQKGRSDLKLASLRRDREWVTKARQVAIALVDADPDLAGHPLLADEVALFLGEDEQDFLLKG